MIVVKDLDCHSNILYVNNTKIRSFSYSFHYDLSFFNEEEGNLHFVHVMYNEVGFTVDGESVSSLLFDTGTKFDNTGKARVFLRFSKSLDDVAKYLERKGFRFSKHSKFMINTGTRWQKLIDIYNQSIDSTFEIACNSSIPKNKRVEECSRKFCAQIYEMMGTCIDDIFLSENVRPNDDSDESVKNLRRLPVALETEVFNVVEGRKKKDPILSSLQKDGLNLQNLENEMRNDRKVVLEAVSENGYSLFFSDQSLRNDKSFVLECILLDPCCISVASERLRECFQTNLEAIRTTKGNALRYVSDRFKNDRKIVLEAVRLDGLCLQYASDELRDDETIVLESVKQNGFSIKFTSTKIIESHPIILKEALVQNEGVAQKYIPEKFRSDKSFFLDLIRVNGLLLKYASETLQGDSTLVIEAMKQNKDAFRFASRKLKKNDEFIIKATSIDPKCWTHNVYRRTWNFEENDEKYVEKILKLVASDGLRIRYLPEEQKMKKKFLCPALENNIESRRFVVKYLNYNDPDILRSVHIGYSRKIDGFMRAQFSRYYRELFVNYSLNNNNNDDDDQIKKTVSEEWKKITEEILDSLYHRAIIREKLNLIDESAQDLYNHFKLSVVTNPLDSEFSFVSNAYLNILKNVICKKIFSESKDSRLLLEKCEWMSDELVAIVSKLCGSKDFDNIMRIGRLNLERNVKKNRISEKIFNLVDDNNNDNNNNTKNIDRKIKSNFEDFIISRVLKNDCLLLEIIDDAFIGIRNPLTNQKCGYGVEFMEIKKKRKKKNRFRRISQGFYFNGTRNGFCNEFDEMTGNLVYGGEYRNGLREGKGIEYRFWKSENINIPIFEGQYQKNKRNGRGELCNESDGRIIRGIWENGKLDDKTVFEFDCPVIKYSSIQKYIRNKEVIGEGGYGRIYSLKSKTFPSEVRKLIDKNQKEVAVKIMRARNPCERSNLLKMTKRGIACVKNLASKEHVLDIYAIIQGEAEVGVVMELCEQSVDKIIESSRRQQRSNSNNSNNNSKLDSNEKKRILYETALGMKSLHEKLVMHRDLKWGNVLLDFDGDVKLTDFDTLKEDELSWRIQAIAQSSRIGTTGFVSPEVFLGKKYTLKCDVFAFGMCNCGTQMELIIRSNLLDWHVSNCNLRPLLDNRQLLEHPSFLIDLMIQAWNQNPFNRPSFNEIVFRFELEKKKSFSSILLQFPKCKGVSDQKMFLTKPYELSKLRSWIEEKFNQRLEDKREEEEGEEEEEERRTTKVISFSHEVLGTISSDEDLVKIIEKEEDNSIIRVELDLSSEFLEAEGKYKLGIISYEEHNKIKEENKKMKEKLEVYQKRIKMMTDKIEVLNKDVYNTQEEMLKWKEMYHLLKEKDKEGETEGED